MRTGFEKEWEHLSETRSEMRCPLAEGVIRQWVQQTQASAMPEVRPMVHRSHPWRWASAAAACLLGALMLSPLMKGDGMDTVDMDGQTMYFACNTGCSAEGTVALLNNYIARR